MPPETTTDRDIEKFIESDIQEYLWRKRERDRFRAAEDCKRLNLDDIDFWGADHEG